MTSPLTQRPATQRPVSLSYSGGLLDRAAGRRADPSWIAALLDDAASARLIPIWRDHCLVSGDPPRPVFSADPARQAILLEAAAPPVFLGLDGAVSVFAADLSALAEERAVQAADAEGVLDVRRLFSTVEPAEAATLAYARGLLYWNRHQQFCGTCGSPTQPRDGGHMRACEREDCARLHFPRIEPAVIMLVESAEAPRRCLLARHRSSAAGGYSTLAGFVEIGESLEDAVRREVAEETGVRVGPVAYVASQAWPFPAGLMAGFLARAESDAVRVDGDEILAARWFTEAELADREAAGHPLGRPDSIDRYLLSTWLAGSATYVRSALAT
jgi:NAD+ diphosphatase